MPAYHQMGHHTENLLFEQHLQHFGGVILSPVNYDLEHVTAQVKSIRAKAPAFDILFDSQLYVPQSQRGELPGWAYYPKAVDTADTGKLSWWQPVVGAVVDTSASVKPNGVCSPAFLPKQFTDEYYDLLVAIGAELRGRLEGSQCRAVQTVVVNIHDLLQTKRSLEIASIISKGKVRDLLVIFHSDMAPRRELAEGDMVRGGMALVGALSRAGFRVLVGFTSADMILWKAAGAWACATGKFFNLRRFTRSRWDEAEEGGMNLPYWFEEGLLAFVRESDLVRLREQGKLSAVSMANPYAKPIFEILDLNYAQPPPEKPTAWVGLSWRQYMYWFADAEKRITDGLVVDDLLKAAEKRWLELDDEDFLMDEARNNGDWVRPWRRALIEFRKLSEAP